MTGALHQHTGTCIEYRDEVYAVLEAMDTKYMKFGPDVGQLAKGGSDPVKIVKDFLPLIRHVHLKDWDGGPHWQQYCPLGKGKVDVPAIVDLLEQSQEMKIIMVELDSSREPPMTPYRDGAYEQSVSKDAGIYVPFLENQSSRISPDSSGPMAACRHTPGEALVLGYLPHSI